MLEERDRPMIKGLVKILRDGTFPIMQKEIAGFHAVCHWANNLESRIPEKKISKKKASKK